MTCGTLTGHAMRSVGSYTISMDNGPARLQNITTRVQTAGESYGEIIERSFVRRDDFESNKAKNSTYDVKNLGVPTPAGSRGHQLAAAVSNYLPKYESLFSNKTNTMQFLTVASGVDKHGKDSDKPLSYTHFDIAGSAMEKTDYKFGKATGSPIISWTAGFILPNL